MVIVLRADARGLPLPDGCVDLIVTSPPYFGLRDYGYNGQIGSEATPGEWLAVLWACTAEWVRVLKPEGSLFVNLGDKYVADNRGSGADVKRGQAKYAPAGPLGYLGRDMARHKSLLGLPWRYALGCVDRLGLILRAEIIWAKPNGMPESVTDRVRRAHEQVFHFTRQPRYYSAVDEIREPQVKAATPYSKPTPNRGNSVPRSDGENRSAHLTYDGWLYGRNDPRGKLPGSVWDIPSQPLTVPAWLGVDHFAAFPMELPRRIIAGWSPPGVCTACNQGRRPVVGKRLENVWHDKPPQASHYSGNELAHRNGRKRDGEPMMRTFGSTSATITGYACACPQPDAPTRPAIVLDPFMGTGTTLLVAEALGRIGVGVDLSMDYCRLARWRTTDPAERAKAMQVPKPPPIPDRQEALFDLEARRGG